MVELDKSNVMDTLILPNAIKCNSSTINTIFVNIY